MNLYYLDKLNLSKDLNANNSKLANKLIVAWGKRLQKAMGEKEVLSRNNYFGGEFRVPTYRQYAEALDQNPWTAYDVAESPLYVVPYNQLYSGWKVTNGSRIGFMAVACNSYEYSYDLWDKMTKNYYPDLLDDGTFGVWLGLLPQPVSIVLDSSSASIDWNSSEERVYRANEMGRYHLLKKDCNVKVFGYNWRIARAEAYVQVWEKMAANEPEDRYESVMLEEHEELEKKWRR